MSVSEQQLKAIQSILDGKNTLYGQVRIVGGTIFADHIQAIGKHGGMDIEIKDATILPRGG